MNVLVTGANGFVGSHLVERLLERGDHVTCLVRCTSRLRWLDTTRVQLAYGDVTDADSLTSAVAGQEVVFHLAALLRGNNYAAYYRVNAEGTRNLAAACVKEGVRRFIYLSSLAASGPSSVERPRREEDSPEPLTDYGRSKLEGERLLQETFVSLPVTIFRAPAVYGPRDTDIYLYFRWMKWRLALYPGDGRQAVDVVYVRDLVEALLLGASASEAVGEIFFINDGSHHTWREMSEVIAETMGCRPVKVSVPLFLFAPVARGAELLAKIRGKTPLLHRQKVDELRQSGWVCDTTKIRCLLGFRPAYSLKEGVKETIRWYRQEGWL